MSAYADQEELEKLKSWWKEYGNSLIFGIALGAAILVEVPDPLKAEAIT